MSLGGGLNIFSGMATNLTGVISGSGLLSGGGPVTISGNNTWTGGLGLFGNLVVGSDSALGTGGLQLTNGTISSSVDVTLNNPFTAGPNSVFGGEHHMTFAGAGTLTGNVPFKATGTVTFSGPLNRTGAFNATTSGTLVLAGQGTFTGTNHFLYATVLVKGTLTGSTTQFITGTFGGTGSVSNFSSVGLGTVSPGGASPGILTLTGGASLSAAGTLAIQLDTSWPSGRRSRMQSPRLARPNPHNLARWRK
jgi:hypothetical protein